MTAGWTVVVPVKPADVGKSRLDVPGTDRMLLARAIALDTVAAAAACADVERVVVVTDDGGLVLAAMDIPGLRFVEESAARAEAASAVLHGGAPLTGRSRLDEAVALGMRQAPARGPRAALLGDLPALRSDDLGAALRAARGVARGVVADAEGTGSTLVTAAPGVEWQSAFGDGSFARHRELGCVALTIAAGSTLRRDVDTAAQLDHAAALGLGPRTAAILDNAPGR